VRPALGINFLKRDGTQLVGEFSMAKKRRSKREFPHVTLESLRILNRLIPYRPSETITARSDKLATAVLQKFLGPDWIEKHITKSKTGYLRNDVSTPKVHETHRMRRIVLAEMLYNLQGVKGFRSCLVELAGGQVESTYGALEIGRMLATTAFDKALTFRFVTPSGISKRDYDLSIKCFDGVRICGETKCKMEETKITLRTIEGSLGTAKDQLPEDAPGIVFVKVPRFWIDDEKFAADMRKLADRFLSRSPSIVSVKYYTAVIVQEEDLAGETIGEIVAFDERTNPNHKFKKFRDRNWHMFPTTQIPAPRPRTNYNGLPSTWQRLFVRTTEL
jgi:hypothetical protein